MVLRLHERGGGLGFPIIALYSRAEQAVSRTYSRRFEAGNGWEGGWQSKCSWRARCGNKTMPGDPLRIQVGPVVQFRFLEATRSMPRQAQKKI